MDFLESEAEESEDETVQKSKKKRIIDSSDEEEEEEDEEKIRDEMKDLINDDVEEEGDSDSGSEQGSKRKHESDLEEDLDDEDYELLEDNLGVKIKKKPKKLKRIRMISDDDDSEKEEESQEREREHIAEELFQGADEDDAVSVAPSRVAPSETAPQNEFGDLDEEDEESDIDDFIVGEDGQPISRKGKKKKHIIHSDRALQEAQDIFGVDFDPEDLEEFDYEQESEEDDEYEEDRPLEDDEERPTKKSKKRKDKKTIYDVFEPSELERGHFTDIDNEIRAADIPERFQLRGVPVHAAEDGELDEEADWIYKHAFQNPTISRQENDRDENTQFGSKGPKTVERIREALNFMRNQQFEVPFIAFYRKEYVEPELNINDLWRVYQWDEKWCQLRTRKKNLVALLEKMQSWQFDMYSDPDKPLDVNVRPLTEEDLERTKEVQSMEELNDVYHHFLLYYGRDVPRMKIALKNKKNAEENPDGEDVDPETIHDDNTPRQANRNSGYHFCMNAGLGDLAKKFGLSPEQFGENLRDNYQRHDVEQYPLEPLSIAKEFISSQFPSADEVLKGVRYMVAMQLAHDPLVRQCIRNTFYERAKISIRPTFKGVKEIDESHPCYTFKYIKNKPVKDLVQDQFMRILFAEEDGLMKVEIHIDNKNAKGNDVYFEEIKQLYDRDEFSRVVQEWNDQRMQALEKALTQILYPQLAKELKGKLMQESKDHVIKACCRKLYHWLKIAPYQPDQPMDDDDEYNDLSNGIKVLAVAYSDERDIPAFGALIDGDGEVTDFIRLAHITKKKNAWIEEDRIAKEQDMKKLKDFIADKKPHVIAVGATNRGASIIIEDIQMVVRELEEENQMPPISVELVDNELAMFYANTKKAEADFRDYPVHLRQAISLARRLQDPLMEFSQLCNQEEDILCLKYHNIQDRVNKDDLLNALYLEFVNRVNEVGVDINDCISHPHTANLAQFICGLGPRKAYSLLKTVRQHGRLENRAQLVTMCLMGPKVFINCAGFIKIDTASLGDSTESYVEVLDGSRVHPETYDWARKMAVDALEYDDTAEDANPASALEEILESPERLKDLDLDAFAEELERQGYGNKHITLYDIRAELNHRYKDLRVQYRSPTIEEKFNLLTKETPETFYIGKLVLCRVTGIARRKPRSEELDQANPVRNDETGLWKCPYCQRNDFPELSEVWSHFDANSCPGQAMGVKVMLDNNCSGFIANKNISDKHVSNPEERVKVHMLMHARIIKVDIERFQVDLTSKSSDLADKDNKWRLQKDLYYDFDTETDDTEKEDSKKKNKEKQAYIKRVIVHPSFHNISYKECEKLMANMEQGEVIVRPSSKGADHLTVTWKVAEGVLQHIDVLEEGKVNAFSLGQTLIINNEEYEDLDEIIARHIQPLAAYARDIINYKYYMDADGGNKEILEKALKDEKRNAMTKIPYYFSATKMYPGKYLLSYIPRGAVKHEYVTITPDGLKYRNQMFHSLNSLVRWFKEHFRDPIPGTPVNKTPRTPSHGMSAVPASTRVENTPAAPITRTPGVPGMFATPQPFATPGMPYGFNAVNTPMMTHMMTPSYHMTPAQAMATPGAQPTPYTPRTAWTGGGMTPRATPITPGAMQPPTSSNTMRQPKSSAAGVDWAKKAEEWAKQRAPPRASPRYGRSPAVGTPRTPNDGTPLYDER